jgi:hypothetical protein
MAKLARPDEKLFNPLSRKLIDEATGVTEPPVEHAKEHEQRTNVVPLAPSTEEHTQRGRAEKSLEIETAEDQLTESMRYRVSRIERKEIERFVQRLSEAANVNLTHSNLMRACRDVLFQAEDRLIAELEKTKLKRPINDRRALTIFESRLAEILHTAIRQTPLSYGWKSRG